MQEYIKRARQQRREESRWKLIILAAFAIAITGFSYTWVWALRYFELFESEKHTHIFIGRLSEFLIAIPGFVLFVPISFIFGNLVGWCIPPARRALDKDARQGKSSSFGDSCRMFLKLEAILLAVMLPLVLFGFLLHRLAK